MTVANIDQPYAVQADGTVTVGPVPSSGEDAATAEDRLTALEAQHRALAKAVFEKPADWALFVGGQPMMRPAAGKEPGALYRALQRLFLGLDWRRVA